MNNTGQEILLYQNRIKLTIALASLAVVMVLFVLQLLHMRQLHIGLPHRVMLCALLLLSGCAYFLLSGIYGLIRKKPVFIINKTGIIDKSFLTGTGLIKWEEIDTINAYRFMHHTAIGIFPDDARAFYSKKWFLARFYAYINMQLGRAPINISQSMLPVSAEIMLSHIQGLQDKSNVRYILVKYDLPKPKKCRIRPATLIISLLVAGAVTVSLGVMLFCVKETPFLLIPQAREAKLLFSSSNLGGYSFHIEKKWSNVSNKKMMSLYKGQTRNDIFFVGKDNPWELWMSVYKDKKIPIAVATSDAKQRILLGLPAHADAVVKMIDEKVMLRSKQSVLSSIYLKNGQILSIITTQCDDLCIVGYLAYNSANMLPIKDLADVLESFRKTNISR